MRSLCIKSKYIGLIDPDNQLKYITANNLCISYKNLHGSSVDVLHEPWSPAQQQQKQQQQHSNKHYVGLERGLPQVQPLSTGLRARI